MKHIIQILKFEYLTCVKNKSFIISTAIFLLLIIIMTFLPALIISMQDSGKNRDKDSSQPVIAVIDQAYHNDELVLKTIQKHFPKQKIKLESESIDDLKNKVDNSGYSFAFIIKTPVSYSYITKDNNIMSVNTQSFSEAIAELYRTTQFQALGIPPEKSAEIFSQAFSFDTITTGVDQTKNYWSTYILVMLLYMSIIMYGQMVSQSVVAEKNTRAMEMLITCAKPSHLMFGKVIGSGLAGLTQLLLIITTAIGSVATIGKNSIPDAILEFVSFPVSTALFAILFFLLGYFIYSFLLGALSSLASRSEDLNTLISPVMILFVAAFMVVIISMTSDSVNSTLMIVCSYIPFTAPVAMFARISLSQVSILEILLSIGVQLLSVYLLGMLAAAIYRIGVLMYGNPPRPSEIFRMLREQHRSNKALKQSPTAERH